MSKNSVKLALVGCGGIAGNHIGGYRDLFSRGYRGFHVVACCDSVEENAIKKAKEISEIQGSEPRTFTDIDELINAGLAEAADVCVPHCFHHSTAIPLIEGGLHVLLEKPVGITIKASKKIIQAAKKHKRVLATAENIRRYISARSCEWAINKGKIIGDMRAISVQSIDHAPFDYNDPKFKWRGIKYLTGGGMIMDSGAHFADMMLHVFGEVDEVYCSMKTFDKRIIDGVPIVGKAEVDVEDTWHAMIRFKSGLFANWSYSRSLYGQAISIGHYYGSKGTMQDVSYVFHPFQEGGAILLANGSTISAEKIQLEYLMSLTDKEKERLFPYGCTDGFSIEVWDFVNAVRTRRMPDIDGNDGLLAKTLCECCYESATIGKPVKFIDVLSGKINEYQKPIDEFWKL